MFKAIMTWMWSLDQSKEYQLTTSAAYTGGFSAMLVLHYLFEVSATQLLGLGLALGLVHTGIYFFYPGKH